MTMEVDLFQMEIHHGWNAHFQDDILTVREDDGISILDWMFASRFFYLYYVLNGYPSWLEWLFAGRYPYCDGGSRNIHPTPFPPVTGGYSG